MSHFFSLPWTLRLFTPTARFLWTSLFFSPSVMLPLAPLLSPPSLYLTSSVNYTLPGAFTSWPLCLPEDLSAWETLHLGSNIFCPGAKHGWEKKKITVKGTAVITIMDPDLRWALKVTSIPVLLKLTNIRTLGSHAPISVSIDYNNYGRKIIWNLERG